MSKAQPGDYTIAVTSADAVIAGAGATQKLTLRAKERGATDVPITADKAGSGTVKVAVSGPGGYALSRSYTLQVRPPAQILARRTVKQLAKGESVTLSSDMFADLVPGTGSVSVSVGSSTALDAAGLLAALDRYPYPLLGTDHEPGAAAPLYERSRDAKRMSRSSQIPISAFATPSTAFWRGRAATARSACGVRAAMTCGSIPTSPTS